MFESDDFDQILSQFDFPEVTTKVQPVKVTKVSTCNPLEIKHNSTKEIVKQPSPEPPSNNRNDVNKSVPSANNPNDVHMISTRTVNGDCTRNINADCMTSVISPKHTKRKIINSFFDPKSKRKFPGPAGLLTGNLEAKDETICHMELLSQDMEFTQNNLRRDLFDSPLWIRVLEDIKSWNLCEVDPIKAIKQQALAGNLRRRKAQTVTAFIETVDRSVIDPLIILRDTTGSIKCTLHRDAWSAFSPYIVSEYCALVLLKPTVLTTGSAFKKHYLNITLSNIYAVYSSAILKEEEDKPFPDGYVRVSEEGFTLLKSEIPPQNFGANLFPANGPINDGSDLLDGLDVSVFSDDLF